MSLTLLKELLVKFPVEMCELLCTARVIEKNLYDLYVDELSENHRKQTDNEIFRQDDTPAMLLTSALIKRVNLFDPYTNSFPDEFVLIVKTIYEACQTVEITIDTMELMTKVLCLRIICPKLMNSGKTSEAKHVLLHSEECKDKIARMLSRKDVNISPANNDIEHYGKLVLPDLEIDVIKRDTIKMLVNNH